MEGTGADSQQLREQQDQIGAFNEERRARKATVPMSKKVLKGLPTNQTLSSYD